MNPYPTVTKVGQTTSTYISNGPKINKEVLTSTYC